MQKFEYKIQLTNFRPQTPTGASIDEGALNLLGKQGWELVSVIGPTSSEIGMAWHFFLRRPLLISDENASIDSQSMSNDPKGKPYVDPTNRLDNLEE